MEEVLTLQHKEELSNGDIIEIKIQKVRASERNPEGIDYRCVYIKKGERLIGYDNFAGHYINGSIHHRHYKQHIGAYHFVDTATLLNDFNEDVEKIKKGIIK